MFKTSIALPLPRLSRAAKFWIVDRAVAHATMPYDADTDRALCNAFHDATPIPRMPITVLVAQTILRFGIAHDTYIALRDNSDRWYVLYSNNLEYKIYLADASAAGDIYDPDFYDMFDTASACAEKLVSLLQPGRFYGFLLF